MTGSASATEPVVQLAADRRLRGGRRSPRRRQRANRRDRLRPSVRSRSSNPARGSSTSVPRRTRSHCRSPRWGSPSPRSTHGGTRSEHPNLAVALELSKVWELERARWMPRSAFRRWSTSAPASTARPEEPRCRRESPLHNCTPCSAKADCSCSRRLTARPPPAKRACLRPPPAGRAARETGTWRTSRSSSVATPPRGPPERDRPRGEAVALVTDNPA